MPKQKLKAALKSAGLPEGLADVINITSEDQIEGVIKQLKPTQQEELDFSKIVASNEFSDFVNNNGFDKVLELSKTLQSEHDKKVTKGVQTFKDKFIKLTDDDDDDSKGKGKGHLKDMPEWFKPFASKIESTHQENETSGKLSKAKEALKKSSIPAQFHDSYLGKFNLESDESFEVQSKKFETEMSELQQFFIGEGTGKGLPMGARRDTDEVKLKKIADMGKEFVSKHKN